MHSPSKKRRIIESDSESNDNDVDCLKSEIIKSPDIRGFFVKSKKNLNLEKKIEKNFVTIKTRAEIHNSTEFNSFKPLARKINKKICNKNPIFITDDDLTIEFIETEYIKNNDNQTLINQSQISVFDCDNLSEANNEGSDNKIILIDNETINGDFVEKKVESKLESKKSQKYGSRKRKASVACSECPEILPNNSEIDKNKKIKYTEINNFLLSKDNINKTKTQNTHIDDVISTRESNKEDKELQKNSDLKSINYKNNESKIYIPTDSNKSFLNELNQSADTQIVLKKNFIRHQKTFIKTRIQDKVDSKIDNLVKNETTDKVISVDKLEKENSDKISDSVLKPKNKDTFLKLSLNFFNKHKQCNQKVSGKNVDDSDQEILTNKILIKCNAQKEPEIINLEKEEINEKESKLRRSSRKSAQLATIAISTSISDDKKDKENIIIVNSKVEEMDDVIFLKKEKSTDCDSALIPLLCVHG